MKEISLNILDIAENSTRAGATLVQITVEEDTAADTLSVTIEDNGSGMSPEFLAQVQDPLCHLPHHPPGRSGHPPD